MSKSIVATAFLLGALAILWMATIFIGSNVLALTITLVIGAVYLLGFMEMRQFRKATATLTDALDNLPEPVSNLEQWLQRLDPSLRNPAQARIEGERVALPAPVLTPYLVGLLVMLGLLGTFVGMVDTLQGAVAALQGTDELQAIRAGLAAPIEGLSLAFGTSVAGVAASAMLGLISTVSRRERMLQTRRLDQQITSAFREFSLVHNRQQTYKALQAQATALPAVAEKMSAMAEQLSTMGVQLSTTLTANQTAFQDAVASRYTELAASVEQSLKSSIAEGGKQTAESIEPIVKAAMTTITEQISVSTENTHKHLTESCQQQLNHITAQVTANTDAWLQQQASADQTRLEQFQTLMQNAQTSASEQQTGIAAEFKQQLQQVSEQQQALSSSLLSEVGKLIKSSDELLDARTASESTWLTQHAEKMDALTQSIQAELTALTQQEEQRSDAALERLSTLEVTVSQQLATLGTALEAPMTRLIETASETPKAAAEVISHLRNEISNNIERDNQLLEERKTLMEQLNALASSLEQSSGNHNKLVEQLVDRSATTLKDIGDAFNEKVDSESNKLAEVTAQFASSASEMASLGDAFGTAVQQFNESNTQLMDTLSHIEQSLEESGARSDEQLGYYIAQAREIIDFSVLSQKQMIEELRQLGQQEQLFAEAAN